MVTIKVCSMDIPLGVGEKTGYFHNGTFIKMYSNLAIYGKEFEGNLLYCAVCPATYSTCATRKSYYMPTVGDVENWIDKRP